MRIRFAGRLVDGFIVSREATSDHQGKFGWLERVISSERVLTAEIAQVVDRVAERYAGTRADVLRLAVPPRHAKVEAEPWEPAEPPSAPEPIENGWHLYRFGDAFLSAIRESKSPRAVWQALPGENWPLRLAELAGAVAASGKSAILVVPDQRDLDRVVAACTELSGADAVVGLSAGLGAGHAISEVARCTARDRPDRRRHTECCFCADARDRSCRRLGRRRRQLVRAAVAVSTCPRSCRPAWLRRRVRRRDRWVLPYGRSAGTRRLGMGARSGRYAGTSFVPTHPRSPRLPTAIKPWPAIREPERLVCPLLHSRPPGALWVRATESWCRCLGGGTYRPWPAESAVPRHGAVGVTAHWLFPLRQVPTAPGHRRAAGAGLPMPPTDVTRAGRKRCARWWSVPAGPPKNSGGRFPV